MEKKYDIIVSGAGPAGFCAAVSAARMGMKVLLIEESDSILGNITAGPLEAIMTFHDGKSQVRQRDCTGICGELHLGWGVRRTR